MKIVCISDTHGLHDSVIVPEGDVLIHAGDFTNEGEWEQVASFNHWLGTLSHPLKIVIAGNHDFCFEREPARAAKMITQAAYLLDDYACIDGVKIYGSPWQPRFYDWAFNLKRGEDIARKWALIPDDTDVLVTHGPPWGFGDQVNYGPQQVGCVDLLDAVHRVKPRLHVFGHIHEAYGVFEDEDTTFVNASLCTVD